MKAKQDFGAAPGQITIIKQELVGKTYALQDTNIYTFDDNGVDVVLGTCTGDNDFAAYTLMATLGFTTPVNLTLTPVPTQVDGACLNASAGDVHLNGMNTGATWRNTSMNPCTSFAWSPLLAFYCPVSCPQYPQLPPTPPPSVVSEIGRAHV